MDSWKTPISPAVRQICDARFRLDGTGCVQCQLRAACHSGPTANLTFERMEEWRVRLNAAASALQPNDESNRRPATTDFQEGDKE